jgi:hypothetical protein
VSSLSLLLSDSESRDLRDTDTLTQYCDDAIEAPPKCLDSTRVAYTPVNSAHFHTQTHPDTHLQCRDTHKFEFEPHNALLGVRSVANTDMCTMRHDKAFVVWSSDRIARLHTSTGICCVFRLLNESNHAAQ